MCITTPMKLLHFSTSITSLFFRFLYRLTSVQTEAATHIPVHFTRVYDGILKNILQGAGKDIHNSQFSKCSEESHYLELCVRPVPLRGTETKTTSCGLSLEQHEMGATSWEAEKVLGFLMI